MSDNGFQFFEGSSTESATSARITVRKGGILVLTRAAVDMLGDASEAVQVGYNPETRALALRPASLGAKGAYRLRGQRNSPSKLVDGKRVFKHHGLAADAPASYDAQDLGDGLVGFTLNGSAASADDVVPEATPSGGSGKAATRSKRSAAKK